MNTETNNKHEYKPIDWAAKVRERNTPANSRKRTLKVIVGVVVSLFVLLLIITVADDRKVNSDVSGTPATVGKTNIEQAIEKYRNTVNNRDTTAMMLAAIDISAAYRAKGDDVNEKIWYDKSQVIGEWLSPIGKLQQWEKDFIGFDGSCRPVAKVIRFTMNDPDSYEHVLTTYKPNKDTTKITVTTSVRGTNAFGAKIIASYKAVVDYSGNILKIEDVY